MKVINNIRYNVLLFGIEEENISFIKKALNENDSKLNLEVIKDSQEVILYFKKGAQSNKGVKTDLVLLDINSSDSSGYEVISIIKKEQHLKHIPVIVLSETKDKKVIDKSYSLGVNCYLTKPKEREGLKSVVKVIEAFWFNVVKFPRDE